MTPHGEVIARIRQAGLSPHNLRLQIVSSLVLWGMEAVVVVPLIRMTTEETFPIETAKKLLVRTREWPTIVEGRNDIDCFFPIYNLLVPILSSNAMSVHIMRWEYNFLANICHQTRLTLERFKSFYSVQDEELEYPVHSY